jgi:hypothetical protein
VLCSLVHQIAGNFQLDMSKNHRLPRNIAQQLLWGRIEPKRIEKQIMNRETKMKKNQLLLN